MKLTKILVTGASGFVGSALIERLAKTGGFETIAAVRSPGFVSSSNVVVCKVGSLGVDTDYRDVLVEVDVVVHCAARVHIMNDASADPLTIYRKINVEGTLNLARQAASGGAKRFIYLSSIKVNGEGGQYSRPYTPGDIPNPSDPYGVSKFEAEIGLWRIAETSGMEVVVIRPPLVYGPGVKANFHTMMSWLYRGVPLPFGKIFNQRSFVSIDNLIDLLCVCIDHPRATNQVFLVSDGNDLSTTELLCVIADALGKPAKLIPVPVWFMRAIAELAHRPLLASRLFDSLQVDISKTKSLLGWAPPVSVHEAIKSTVQHFMTAKN